MKASEVAAVLGEVLDPELGIDIVSLGLIYGIHIEAGSLEVEMTMTSPDCPMGTTIAGMAASRLRRIAHDREVRLEVVEEPEWNIRMASRSALEQLGLPAS